MVNFNSKAIARGHRWWRTMFDLFARRPVGGPHNFQGRSQTAMGAASPGDGHLPYAVRFRSANGAWRQAAKRGRMSHIVTIDGEGMVVPFSHPSLDGILTERLHPGAARLLNQGWTPDEIAFLITQKRT
jgi:hypothetical protein